MKTALVMIALCIATASSVFSADQKPGVRAYSEKADGGMDDWEIHLSVDIRGSWVEMRVSQSLSGQKDFARWVTHSINFRDLKSFEAMLTKFLQWCDTARTENAPEFEKDFPKIGSSEWQMKWRNKSGHLVTQFKGESLGEKDAKILRVLLLDLPEMISEYNTEVHARNAFMEKLK